MQYFDINASSNYFNLSYVLVLLTIHFAFIALLAIQAISGSRFFLPDSMRTRVYEKMIRKIEANNSENTLYCQICTNLLDQPELEYVDFDLEYKRVYFPLGYYIQTDCLHIFHPNCILKSVSNSQMCPVCSYYFIAQKFVIICNFQKP